MRLFNRLLQVVLLTALLATACEKEPKAESQPTLATTYSTMTGDWQLTSWGGIEPMEGLYSYLRIEGSERSFAIYDNLSTMYTHLTTGCFTIEQNDLGEYIVRGSYDYNLGDWNDDYRVVILSPGDNMVWYRLGDNEELHYTLIDTIPEEIIRDARTE